MEVKNTTGCMKEKIVLGGFVLVWRRRNSTASEGLPGGI